MCLIVFAWDVHPKYKLILAANRDEFYERPTAPAHFWEDQPHILGGRDLQAGGSWMTISGEGKFAAVTNYRDPQNIRKNAVSRGEIPTRFLNSQDTPEVYLKQLHEKAAQHNGFNVLTGNFQQLMHYSNYEGKLNVISPGIHGLSNALLDTGWPKVERAKSRLAELTGRAFSHEELLEMMGDTAVAEDAVLPETGVPRELEKALSAMCIRTEKYGTCCSTVITIDRQGSVAFTEKSYPVGGRKDESVQFQFQIEHDTI